MTGRPLALGLLLLLPILASCGDSTSAPVPSRLVVSPGEVTLSSLGLSQPFSATLEDKKGKPVSGAEIAWISSNPQVATISVDGTATALSRGTTTIEATAEGLTGRATLNVSPAPAALDKIQGDEQVGALSQPLPQVLEVEVTDSQGFPIVGQSVTFSVLAGSGTVSPSSTLTDAAGRATASWTLGCSNADPQRARAAIGGVTVEFTATADLSLPAICQATVPDGRATLAYSAELEAVGGDISSKTWEVAGGDLPGGITLSPGGILAGTPVEAGSFTFQARVVDGAGLSASRSFDLRVCPAPISLVPGHSTTVFANGNEGCGFFLPTGESGDRYRLGVVWSTSNENNANPALVTVRASKKLTIGASPEAIPQAVVQEPRATDREELLAALPESFREALRVEEATEAFHRRLRASERALLARLGPGARPLPDRPVARTTVAGPQAQAPEKLSLISNSSTECSSTARATALKLGENEYVAIYQDSAQAQIDSLRISGELATMMLDYYEDYGAQVIEEYFGGVTDINGDGQVVVLITPVVGTDVAAYVWSGDFFPRSSCPASNEMELVRFNARTILSLSTGNYQAVGTLVHEMKHVSSLYNSIVRDFDYQPSWIEEGTAEIAAEMSSRLAWAADGGPAVTGMIRRSDKVITQESYGVLLRWVRTIFYLNTQPNGLVVKPVGAGDDFSVYGSGWHFHRWLGDAYGNAALQPLAEAPLFRALNDSLATAGPNGITATAGDSWEELMDRYYSAVLLNGTGAPQPDWAFTSYDFPDVTTGLLAAPHQPAGTYPWPVNVGGSDPTQPFSSFINTGAVGASGIRVFDLTSDGVGLGLEVKVETDRQPVRIIVVRIE